MMMVMVLAVAVAVGVMAVVVAWILTGRFPETPPSMYAKIRAVGPIPSSVPKRQDAGRQPPPPAAGVPIAVIGGAGFVGQYLVESLLYRGESSVTIFDINEPPKHFKVRCSGIPFVKVNITDPESIRKALLDNKIKIVGTPDLMTRVLTGARSTAATITHMHHMDFQLGPSMNINYKGTVNVVEACIAAGVHTLVQTSSSHVQIGYDNYHIDQGDEETPGYSEKPFNFYTKSKILAEKAVLAADKTIGPSDYIYVENLTHCLSVVEHGVRTQADKIGGEVFCVSEDDGLSGVGLTVLMRAVDPSVRPAIPVPPIVVWSLGMFSTITHWLFRGRISLGELDELTLASYHVLMSQYTFRSKKVKRMLGYRPLYTLEEAAVVTLARRREAEKVYGGSIPSNLPQKIKH
ncbi:hypothetical protein HDU67_007302 [Dinochytrium kinnereticum]|nr:hypothetical protein HDU67_007302 [Dinochytrium kinnereticum]